VSTRKDARLKIRSPRARPATSHMKTGSAMGWGWPLNPNQSGECLRWPAFQAHLTPSLAQTRLRTELTFSSKRSISGSACHGA